MLQLFYFLYLISFRIWRPAVRCLRRLTIPGFYPLISLPYASLLVQHFLPRIQSCTLPPSSSVLFHSPHSLPSSLGCYISLPVTLTDLMRSGVGGWLLLQPCTPRLSYSVLFLPSPLHIVFRFAYFFLIALTPPSPLPPLTAYSFMSCSGSVDSTKPWHVGPGMNLCSGWNRVPPGLFFYRYYINNWEISRKLITERRQSGEPDSTRNTRCSRTTSYITHIFL